MSNKLTNARQAMTALRPLVESGAVDERVYLAGIVTLAALAVNEGEDGVAIEAIQLLTEDYVSGCLEKGMNADPVVFDSAVVVAEFLQGLMQRAEAEREERVEEAVWMTKPGRA